jgi:capsular polysaccharide biosynthesis protein
LLSLWPTIHYTRSIADSVMHIGQEKFPPLRSEPFDRQADYSTMGSPVASIALMSGSEHSLSQLGIEMLGKAKAVRAISRANSIDIDRLPPAYGPGSITCEHGLFHVERVSMILPNGAAFLSGDRYIIEETTWQSRIEMHPCFKRNHSTGWKFRKITDAPSEGDHVVSIEEPVVSCYFRMHEQYFHWFIDVLPRIWVWKRFSNDEALFFVGPLGRNSFQLQSLMQIGIDPKMLIDIRAHRVNFERLFLPVSRISESLHVRPSFQDGIHFKGGWDREYLLWINAVCRRAASVQLEDGHERLYVDRRNSLHRRLVGADRFEEYLRQQGFRFVDPGSFGLLEQQRIFSQARIIVGVHGAGLTNIMWCNPSDTVKILEIVPRGLNDTGYHFISDAMGFEHHILIGETVEEEKNYAWSDITVDSDLAISAVSEIIY